MHDQDRHGDPLEVRGEIGLGEGDDAVVVGLGPARHALPPPVIDDGFHGFHAGPVEAVKGPDGSAR